MKVAHWGVFAPCQSGQYETVKELIMAERKVGIDAEFIDFGYAGQASCRVGLIDGEIKTANPHWCDDADIMLRHSDIPKDFMNKDIPYVMCLHGRPENTFLVGYRSGKYPIKSKHDIYKIIQSKQYDKNCVGYITFWEEYLELFKDLLPNASVNFVPAPVDLDKYNPEGKKRKFDVDGSPNIIVTDMWRDDVTPYNVIQGAIHYIKHYNSDAKLHVYGIWGNDYRRDFLKMYQDKGYIGEIQKFVLGLENVYRSADIMVTPHTIATRTVREALASGLHIVAGGGSMYAGHTADPRNYEEFSKAIDSCWGDVCNEYSDSKVLYRELAEKEFNMDDVGRKMKGTLEYLLNDSVKERLREHKIVEENHEPCFSLR